MDAVKARVLGHLYFDGCVSVDRRGNHRINYSNASIKSIKNFAKLVELRFHLKQQKIRYFEGEKGNYCQIEFGSKKLVKNLIRRYGNFSTSKLVTMPSGIIGNKAASIQFLKAFWDDEGCITTDRLRIHGALMSETMIDGLIFIHRKLGIQCTKWCIVASTGVLRIV